MTSLPPWLLGLSLLAPPALPPLGPSAQAQGEGWLLRQALWEACQAEARRGGLRRAAVLVVGPQGPLWQEAIAPEAPEPQWMRRPHRLGLASGLFTSLAALQLHQEGRWRLGDPLRRWLPEAPWGEEAASSPIRLTHLLDGSSGLSPTRWSGLWSLEDPASLLQQPLPRLQLPGQSWQESTLAQSLLGLALGRASGKPFRRLMNQELLPAWGMAGASYGPGLAPGLSDEEAAPPARDEAALGLQASPAQLASFLHRLTQEEGSPSHLPLAPSLLREMAIAHHPLPHQLEAGWGWMRQSLGPLQVPGMGPVLHLGSSLWGQHLQLVHLPEAHLAFAVLGAGASPQARPAVNRLAELLAEGLARLRRGPRPQPTVPPLGPWPEATQAAWVGRWATPLGLLELEAQGPHRVGLRGWPLALVGEGGGAARLCLGAFGVGAWPLGGAEAPSWRPLQVGDRKEAVASLGEAHLSLGQKLPALQPCPPAWRARLGRHPWVGPAGERPACPALELSLQEGQLLLRFALAESPQAPQLLAVRPTSEAQAQLWGAGLGAGWTLQALPDGGLSLFGARFGPPQAGQP